MLTDEDVDPTTESNTQYDPPGPEAFSAYAFGQIALLKTPSYRSMHIREAMDRAGLNLQIQSAIADPAFSDILWTRDRGVYIQRHPLNRSIAFATTKEELNRSICRPINCLVQYVHAPYTPALTNITVTGLVKFWTQCSALANLGRAAFFFTFLHLQLLLLHSSIHPLVLQTFSNTSHPSHIIKDLF
jgi:hypothetical protein